MLANLLYVIDCIIGSLRENRGRWRETGKKIAMVISDSDEYFIMNQREGCR